MTGRRKNYDTRRIFLIHHFPPRYRHAGRLHTFRRRDPGIIQFVDVSFLSQVPVIAYKTLDSYVLTSVPLYILMSQIMLDGPRGSGLFELGSKWMGHLPGGLGIATIFACAIFAAISGSSVATAVTIGAMAIPEMLKRGYDRKRVVGSVAAGGTLGILIPLSIPMILVRHDHR